MKVINLEQLECTVEENYEITQTCLTEKKCTLYFVVKVQTCFSDKWNPWMKIYEQNFTYSLIQIRGLQCVDRISIDFILAIQKENMSFFSV